MAAPIDHLRLGTIGNDTACIDEIELLQPSSGHPIALSMVKARKVNRRAQFKRSRALRTRSLDGSL